MHKLDIMGISKKDNVKSVVKGKVKKSRPVEEPKPKASKSAGVSKSKSKSKSQPEKKKKKKTRERMDTELASDDDDEAQVVDNGEDDEAEDVVENVSDDEDNVKAKKSRASKPDTRTEAEKAKEARTKSARRNAKAKRRGYRTISKRAGYSTDVKRAGHDGSYDVAVPVTTTSEAIRACKWVPTQEEKAAFEGLTEFDERMQLSLESLPKSAARVLQAHGEQYLRRLSTKTVQCATDQLKTRATAAMVASVTRPLKRSQKYSFVAPQGIVRYAQGAAKGMRLEYADGEQTSLESEKALHKLQVSLKKQLISKAKAAKNPVANKVACAAADDRLAEIRKQAKKENLA